VVPIFGIAFIIPQAAMLAALCESSAMPITLGLDDDLDSVEVVQVVESAFNIKIADKEAEAIVTVGEMFDLLRQKIAGNATDRKCASAMAFYRLRRVLAARHVDSSLTPASNLSWLRDTYTKRYVRALEQETGLRLPKPAHSWIGRVGASIAILGVIGALVAVALALSTLFFGRWNGDAIAGSTPLLLFGCLIFGALLACLDPGHLPKQFATLGDLAKKTANLSYGILVEQGADASESQSWRVLTEVLSDFTGVSAGAINRDTHFLGSSPKRIEAA
jgi:hypothetical protein